MTDFQANGAVRVAVKKGWASTEEVIREEPARITAKTVSNGYGLRWERQTGKRRHSATRSLRYRMLAYRLDGGDWQEVAS
jgi:hypothetical protein